MIKNRKPTLDRIWYVYIDYPEDRMLAIAAPGAPETKRAAEDCIFGPATQEEVWAWWETSEYSLVWRC